MLPLEKVRVLSFGTGGVVPDFGKIMGELGADVIKIESRDNLDFMRTIGPDINNIAGFNEANRNKRSFGVNLKAEKSKGIVSRLIEMADVLAENFRGGVMESLGLDYESVRRINPNIIYISSQGFGGGGPYSSYQAYGPMLSAASGMLSIWAQPDDPYPVGSNAPIPDHMGSKYVVVAALAALDYRRRTGKGQYVNLAQTEVAASMVGEYYLDFTMNHRVPGPMGNRSPYAAPHGCYRCKGNDQWCAITVFTDAQWRSFCQAIGRPEWIDDRRFVDTLGRLRNVDELEKIVEEWTSVREPQEVMEILQAAGVPAGVVQRAPDSLADPQLKSRGAVIELDHPVAGKRFYPGIPYRLSGASPGKSTPAPLLGQHTEEICREVLGMREGEIESLKKDGVLYGASR
ncbi:MAG: CoA transferase [Chloroflexi bacterium]|nr:CoA transferase [Chloroflexota bacterium]